MEVAGETLATFREARGRLEREVGHALDDDAVLLLMARQALGGPTDDGRASYQVALTVCARCGQGYQHGHGELVAVGPEVVEMAQCDAQDIGDVQGAASMRSGDVEARRDLGEPVLVDETHVGRRRATQTIPPATRRAVVRRDHGRCVVPGCRGAKFLDVHHVKPRAEGGDHDPDLLVLLCGQHHRALHAGYLRIEGSVSAGLVFRHADGTTYGGRVSPGATEVLAQAFGALTKLGYREREARAALDRVRTHVGRGLRELLVEALSVLRTGVVDCTTPAGGP
jgi:hypothetical protein